MKIIKKLEKIKQRSEEIRAQTGEAERSGTQQ